MQHFTIADGRGRFSVISAVSILRTGLFGVRIPVEASDLFSKTFRPGRGPPNRPFNGYRGLFPPKTKRTVREVGHIPAFRAEVKSEWSYTSISIHAFMAGVGTFVLFYSCRRTAQINWVHRMQLSKHWLSYDISAPVQTCRWSCHSHDAHGHCL
jgi:hypothetical protein